MSSNISLTELRQNLFKFADQVIATGKPLVIVRNGVRLRLQLEEAPKPKGGRLSRLKKQTLVVGPPLDPNFSPAQWSGEPLAVVHESAAPPYRPDRKRPQKRP